jgi:hypothetical protein
MCGVRHVATTLFEVIRTENDPNRIRRWSSAGQRRTSPGMLLRVAGCSRLASRYTTQLLSQPHAALLTQISTHAVHCAWSRARVRDNNFTSGGRGSLYGRHSRGEGMTMHSTAAQPPSRQRAFPSQPSCCPVHRRSSFRWTLSSTRYRSLCPTGTGIRA